MDMFLNHSSFSSSSSSSTMASNGCSIQDQILEVTVVSGTGLKDTERYGKQDPYVVVKYGSTEYRTRTCKDGGKNPVFYPDKFQFKLIEGIRELRVTALNSNNLIGKRKVCLKDVFSSGYQDRSYLLTNNKMSAGEIKLILHYLYTHKPEATLVPPSPAQAPFQPPQCPVPAFYQNPALYPPFPAHQPQYAPQQQPLFLAHQPQYAPQQQPLFLAHQPQYAPQQQPTYQLQAVYPPQPYFAPPSPYHGSYAPS